MYINNENLSRGKKNALARSRQLTEFSWSPLKDVPVFTKIHGRTVLRAGSSVKGMIYSSTKPKIEFSEKDGVLYIKADSCDSESKIHHMDFREGRNREVPEVIKTPDKLYYNNCCTALSGICTFSEEEKVSGVFSRVIPEDAGNFKISFENKYGIWTHTMIHIFKEN